MSWAVALLGAAGLTLAYLGLPRVGGRRLARRVDPYVAGVRGRPSPLLRPLSFGRRARIEVVVDRILKHLGFAADEGLADRLAGAGLEPVPAAFRLDQVVWALTATVGSWIALTCAFLAGLSVDLRVLPVVSILAMSLGFLGRDWWLTRQTSRRRARLQDELPSAIDLITLSIMAGESIPAALERVARVLPGDTADEFDAVVGDVRAGATVFDALEALKSRVPVVGIARFVDALTTALERGTPLADVLRAQANDAREARRRELIEMGGRREVLMLVPVVFLILPVLVAFALLPGLVSLDLLVP